VEGHSLSGCTLPNPRCEEGGREEGGEGETEVIVAESPSLTTSKEISGSEAEERFCDERRESRNGMR